MQNNYSQFLTEMAARLMEIADRAPDIGVELRRFADDLIELAAKSEEWRDRPHDLPD